MEGSDGSSTAEDDRYSSSATVVVLAGFLGVSISDIESNHIPLWVLEQSARLKAELFGKKNNSGSGKSAIRRATQADMDNF